MRSVTLMDRTRLGIVVACTTGNAISMTPAVHAVFGIFLIPLATSFHWQRAAISGVLGVAAIISAIVLPLAGQYADRHGARGLALGGNLMLAGAIALLSLTNGSIVQFYLTFALVAIAGSIASTALFSKVISDWFDDQRGAMLGISAGLGNGLGAAVLPIAASAMISVWGWRGSYLGIGVIVALIGFPTMFVLLRDASRYAPAKVDTLPAEGLTLAQAARTPVFWLLLVAIASGAGCLTAVFSHIVPLLTERKIGIGTSTALIGIFALATAAWQITVGTLLDRIPSSKLAAPLFLVAVAGLALLQLGHGLPMLSLAAVMLGIGLGTQYGVLPYFIARYFGLRSFGAIIGAMYAVVSLLQGATPILLDHGFDVAGSYRSGVIVIGLCLTAGAGLLLLLPPYRQLDPA